MNKKALIFLAIGLGGFFFMRKASASEKTLKQPMMKAGYGFDGGGYAVSPKPNRDQFYTLPPEDTENDAALTVEPGIKVPDSPTVYQAQPDELQAVNDIEHGGNILNLDRQLGWNGGSHFTRLL